MKCGTTIIPNWRPHRWLPDGIKGRRLQRIRPRFSCLNPFGRAPKGGATETVSASTILLLLRSSGQFGATELFGICHISEMQRSYLGQQIGIYSRFHLEFSLEGSDHGCTGATRVKAEGRVAPDLFRFLKGLPLRLEFSHRPDFCWPYAFLPPQTTIKLSKR